MFIAAVLIGSILGYAAAGLLFLTGMPLLMVVSSLIGIGLLGTMTAAGVTVLHCGDLQDELALA